MHAIVWTAMLFLGPDAEQVTNEAPQAQVDSAVKYGLELLKKEEYEQFVNKLVEPAELEKFLKTRTIDELVRGLSKSKGKSLVVALEQAREQEPAFNESKSLAEFTIELPGTAKKKMVFVKFEERWYLRN